MPVGRKPTPTDVAKLRGNPHQHKLNDNEPKPEIPDELPIAPAWLGSYGRKEWDRVAPYLWANKLLTIADETALAAYCQNVDQLVEATLDIQENGYTIIGARGPVRNPALATFAQATTALRAMAAEFGMTPSSRSRIKLPNDPATSLKDLEPTIQEEPK